MSCSTKNEKVIDRFPDKTAELEAYIESFPRDTEIRKRRGNLIASLHKAQEQFGYLPESVQLLVADKFMLQLADVRGVVSFYSYFTVNPPGKHKINVCTGTACFVKGANYVLSEFEAELGIKDGETTADLEFSLGGLRCVGACSLAPVVMVNDRVYGNVTPEMVKDILSECPNQTGNSLDA